MQMYPSQGKTTPPFLNSFNCTAITLSYMNTARVIALLNLLSKSTFKYLEGHAPYLNQFLQGSSIPAAIKFGPDEFGDLPHNWRWEALFEKPLDLYDIGEQLKINRNDDDDP